jgi:predicted amino acid-binding ACT domain protein
MNKIRYIFYFILLFLFYSCEQPSEEENIPYIPKLVIRGIISEGTSVKDIYIGRTMPVSVKIDPTFTDLTDAAAFIVHNNQFYPLSYTHNGLYKNDTLKIIRGEKYTLLASWQNLSANAETTIPIPGKIPSFSLQVQTTSKGNIHVLQSQIIPFSDEVYAATWVLLYLNNTVSDESQVFSTVTGKDSRGIAICTTSEIPSNYINMSNTSLTARVYIFDHQFLDFYSTQNLNQVSDAIFGQTGSQVKWNIKGDGIGMFIGRLDTLLSK